MKTVAIIQARMGSSRLPGKMLMPLLDQPLIAWIVGRVRRAERCHETVVATTTAKADDALVQWCETHDVPVFRGSERDVLDRFYRCANAFGATHVVRLTGDCPLLDWRIVDEVVCPCVEDEAVDYSTNCEPMTYPEGISAEAVPMSMLGQMHRQAVLPSHREHVTPYVRFAPDRFRHAVLRANPDLSHLRLTVDYREDLQMLHELTRELQRRGILETADVWQIAQALEQRPDIRSVLCDRRRDLWRQEVAREEQRKIA